MRRHHASKYLICLRRIDWAVKKTRDSDLVLDNYSTHKTPEVQGWLDKHPSFKLSALGVAKTKADVGASYPQFIQQLSSFGNPMSGVER